MAQKAAVALAVTSMAAGGIFAVTRPTPVVAELLPAPAEMTFEKKKKKAKSAEEYRDMISSQHLQVEKSWENPGVYAW